MARSSFVGVLAVSLLVAVSFHFWPLRGESALWRPLFVPAVVVYWLLVEPHRLGIGFAWLAGLGLDVLTGGTFGQHALAMAVCAYALSLAGQRLHHFTVWHQAFLLALLALLYQGVLVFVGLLAGASVSTAFVLYPVITTVLLWPLAAGILSRFYRPE